EKSRPRAGAESKPNSALSAMRSRVPGKYMRRPSPRPSSTWRTFLEAHIGEIVAVDFFVVPTLTFQALFGFLILRHHRRELVHVNATDHPTAAWAAHQLVESFPEETAPTYLLRDRDAIYGDVFVRRVKGLGMREILIAPRAPWQNLSLANTPSDDQVLELSARICRRSRLDDYRVAPPASAPAVPRRRPSSTRPREPSAAPPARGLQARGDSTA